jgi:hypothetical protein
MAKAKKKKRADYYDKNPSINVSVIKVPETAIESKEKKEEEKPVQKKKVNKK